MNSHQQGFLTLFDRMPVASMLTRSSDSTVLAINPTFEATFGWAPTDVIGKSSADIGLWQSVKQRDDFLERFVVRGRIQQFETSLLCRDGSQKACLVYVEPIDIDGENYRLSMAHDISERKDYETALRNSENKFAMLFRQAPEPYALFDVDTAKFIEINDSFNELFGYSPNEIIGKTAVEIGFWQNVQARKKVIRKLIQVGRLRNEPATLLTLDRRALECEVSSNFIYIGDQRRILSSFKDVTEQRLIEARIKHQACHDALTDLPNRLLLTDRLRQHLSLCERHSLSCALLFFDLDHFKHINDSLGHTRGDAVLQEIGRRLLASLRKSDTVARLGGDEFVVLLSDLRGQPEEMLAHVTQTATKLLQAVAAPMQIDGHSLQLGCSIGIAMAPEHGNNPDDLLKHADIALYSVKDGGRDGIAVFQPHMEIAARERLEVESELRRALLSNEFQLHYQPQINSAKPAIIGAEALLRWLHPQRGLVSPGVFMHVLEESGMILDVGRWVLNEACAFIARLLQSGQIQPDSFSLSVNISPRQFRHPEFVDDVARAIEQHGTPSSCLSLEITEGMVIQNVNDTIDKMHQLRNLGIRFAIDDFGTGYSSLSYLKRLPVDVLKIDQSFVRDCTRDSNDAEIVRAIIAMARSLNMDLIAEGVETEQQLAFLLEQGCSNYQGYLFSPAVTEEAFCQLLAGH